LLEQGIDEIFAEVVFWLCGLGGVFLHDSVDELLAFE